MNQPPPPPQWSADGRQWWNGHAWVEASQASQPPQPSTDMPPSLPVPAAPTPSSISKWDLVVVATLAATVAVVAIGLSLPSHPRSTASTSPPDPTIGRTLPLGTEVSGSGSGDAVYNFTTTGAFKVVWSAKAVGSAGCTFLGVVTNADHVTLDLASNSGSLDGGESGPHVLRLRWVRCAWTLKVR